MVNLAAHKEDKELFVFGTNLQGETTSSQNSLSPLAFEFPRNPLFIVSRRKRNHVETYKKGLVFFPHNYHCNFAKILNKIYWIHHQYEISISCIAEHLAHALRLGNCCHDQPPEKRQCCHNATQLHYWHASHDVQQSLGNILFFKR
jgi:hypothetical protein